MLLKRALFQTGCQFKTMYEEDFAAFVEIRLGLAGRAPSSSSSASKSLMYLQASL